MIFFRVKVFSFQFYQKRGHLLGSWLYFNMYIKGPDYRKNGLRSTKRKGTAWECFFCVFYTCNGLICSSQSRLCMVFPFCRIQHPKKNKNKQTRNPEIPPKKRAPTQETKKQRNKTNCTPKTGEDAENWVPSCFLFCLFFWFIVFLVPCFFWRAGRTKKVAGPNLLLLLPA